MCLLPVWIGEAVWPVVEDTISWDDEEDDRGLERRSLCMAGDVATVGLLESGCDGEGCRVEKIKLPRAAGGS